MSRLQPVGETSIKEQSATTASAPSPPASENGETITAKQGAELMRLTVAQSRFWRNLQASDIKVVMKDMQIMRVSVRQMRTPRPQMFFGVEHGRGDCQESCSLG